LRLASGPLADRTGRYWAITITGYAVNLLAVPLLAVAGRWETAALLIVLERAGKALRTPARDVMLSYATREIGRGWGFGLHEALDQVGALAGPLLVAWTLHSRGGYPRAFAVLAGPAVTALAVLAVARGLYPDPRKLDCEAPRSQAKRLPLAFWVYLAAAALVAAGYADFALIAFHLKNAALTPETWIPILYAVAMGVDAIAALVFGRLFDRWGVPVLALASLVAAPLAPLVFLGRTGSAVAGIVLWGVGFGAQESVLRAAVAEMVEGERRGAAYGTFQAIFGCAWFAGSAFMGALYEISLPALAAVSTGLQLAAVALFLWVARSEAPPDSETA